MAEKIRPRVRKLYDWEIAQITPIFGDTLRYEKVRVCEGFTWPDFTNRLGRLMRRQAPPGPSEHNAITLGNRCYFPIELPKELPPEGHWDFSNMDWLVHELTHAWQYQHIGIKYLFRALWAQFRLKEAAYEYGGLEGLFAWRLEGGNLFGFNMEAQASIVEDFYRRIRKKMEAGAYLSYLQDLRKAI